MTEGPTPLKLSATGSKRRRTLDKFDARFKLKKQPKTVEALVSMFVSACFSDAPLAPLHTRTARGE